MTWLIIHTVLLLFIAYFIGYHLGYWIQGIKSARTPSNMRTRVANVTTGHKAAENQIHTTYADYENVPVVEPEILKNPVLEAQELEVADTPNTSKFADQAREESVESTPELESSDEIPVMGLKSATHGPADHLQEISGIGKKIEDQLHELGIFYFEQIAAWNKKDRELVNDKLRFKGRIEREKWVEQAKERIKQRNIVEQLGQLSNEMFTFDDDDVKPKKPSVMRRPRNGKADDLKKIKGIGEGNEARLHDLGIFHFDQIVKWGQPECRWINDYVGVKNRVQQERWIEQAFNLIK